jgi:hypothetical protein
MIAVLKCSGFRDRKWTKRLDCAGCNHTFVFPAARDISSGHLSIAAEQTNEASSVWFGAPDFKFRGREDHNESISRSMAG